MFVPMSVSHGISALSLTARARYILPGRSLLRLPFISSTVAPLCHIATMDDGTMELDLLDQIVTIHERCIFEISVMYPVGMASVLEIALLQSATKSYVWWCFKRLVVSAKSKNV